MLQRNPITQYSLDAFFHFIYLFILNNYVAMSFFLFRLPGKMPRIPASGPGFAYITWQS